MGLPVADQEVEMELWLEDPTTERPVIVDGKPSLPAGHVVGIASG